VLQLIQAIESSWAVLQDAVAALQSQQSWEAQCEAVEERTQKTAGEVYMETMRPLQFGRHAHVRMLVFTTELLPPLITYVVPFTPLFVMEV